MSYEFYKMLHLGSLILVAACVGIGFFVQPGLKWARMLGMSASFLLMVAGMGLLARLYPGESWPLWVKVKLGLWFVLAMATPILARKLTRFRALAFGGICFILFLAIALAVLKPWG